jgi:hypothetical protein
MPATDAPTSQQAAIIACLNSSAWFRMWRLGLLTSIVSTIVIGGHYLINSRMISPGSTLQDDSGQTI